MLRWQWILNRYKYQSWSKIWQKVVPGKFVARGHHNYINTEIHSLLFHSFTSIKRRKPKLFAYPTVVMDTKAHQNPSHDPLRNFLGNCSSLNHISWKAKVRPQVGGTASKLMVVWSSINKTYHEPNNHSRQPWKQQRSNQDRPSTKQSRHEILH
jgi:hypothetical protein